MSAAESSTGAAEAPLSSFLSNPTEFLFHHATLFSQHVIKIGEALYEVWEDSQISLTDPDTSPIDGDGATGGVGQEYGGDGGGGLPEQASQFHEAVSGTLDSILKGSIKPPGGSKLQTKESFIDDVSAFFAAIDFEADKWIFGVLAFHAVTFLCILNTRGRTEVQACLFVFLALVIRACETGESGVCVGVFVFVCVCVCVCVCEERRAEKVLLRDINAQ